MAVKVTQPKFVASDGKEFDNPEDADRHETLVGATAVFEQSRRNLLHAMAHTKRTADGELMNPTRWGTYYIVREWASEPHVAEVSFYYNTQIDLRGEKLYLVALYSGRNHESQSYPIDELYAKKKNADATLRKVLEKRAEELQKRINELPRAALDKAAK